MMAYELIYFLIVDEAKYFLQLVLHTFYVFLQASQTCLLY